MAVKKNADRNPLAGRKVESIELRNLDLDSKNPRFGDNIGKSSQAQVVSKIVTDFGIDDLLASLAINGYFESEPLVARRAGKRFVVVEGNRRLAASLILAGDDRAKAFANRKTTRAHDNWTPDTRVPVLVVEPGEERKLLPYLGVRHIVGSQAWDSYAKARWIHEVTSTGDMSLDEVAEAIGDSHRTVHRMLDGYLFITQLIAEGRFKPSESQRRGRGSNPDYPFSWIYTLLDNSVVRDFFKLPPRGGTASQPIPAKSLGAAARTMVYMFGDKSRNPSITDSRQIGDLADCLVDPVQRNMLDQGLSVVEIQRRSRSTSDQLAELLNAATENLREATALIAETKMSASEAAPFRKVAEQAYNLASDIFSKLGATKPHARSAK
jgi:ParB-like chromosome segregation protein Spo0J